MVDAPQVHYQGQKALKPVGKANGKTFKQAPVQVKPVKSRKPKGKK